MNRLHTGQAISSHGPPSSNIAFENISCHDCNPSMMKKTSQWGQHLSTQDIQLFSFLQTNNCNLEFLQNATCLFAPEQTTTIYHKNESGADWRWTERWNGERWTKWLLKTLNWTQRIILKHQLRPGELGMLTLSLVLNAAAGGGGNITNLLLLFIIVVLILVLVVLIVKALICAVDQSTVVLAKFSLLMI